MSVKGRGNEIRRP